MASPLEISLPPGVVKSDSQLAATGRYYDSDNVRFFRGKPEKIGGNVILVAVPLGNPVRGMHTWNDLTTRQLLAAGTATQLFAIPNTNYVPIDITPVGLAPGLVDPGVGFGWGAGTWGLGTWGTTRFVSSFVFDPRIWSLDNFGKILLAAPSDGSLYSWDPTVNPEVPAALVTTAPPQLHGFWQTAEIFTIAFGCTGPNGEPPNLMRIYWSAQGTYTDWNVNHTQSELAELPGAPSGSRQLQFGTKIVAGIDIGSFTSLIWTDAALYTHVYTGSANTFNTLLVGQRCGLLSRYSFAIVGGAAFWISNGNFWLYNGTVQRIPNADDISEWFFGQLRQDNYSSKAFAYHNVRYSEVWFCIVPLGETEPMIAAVVNIDPANGFFWFPCTLERTAATNYSQLDPSPVLADLNGVIHQHETGLDDDADPLAWHLATSFLEVEKGQSSFDIFGLMPDMQRQIGSIVAQIDALDRTPTPIIETESESFSPTDGLIDYRIAGREIALTLSCNALGSDFRLGTPKIEFQPGGERR